MTSKKTPESAAVTSRRSMLLKALSVAVAMAAAPHLVPAGTPLAHAHGADGRGYGPSKRYAGMLYALTNAEEANSVIRYGRRSDGSLVLLDETETGGVGSGIYLAPRNEIFGVVADPLLNAHGIQLTDDRRFLLTVNAGDDTVSVFSVKHDGRLELEDRVDSDGRVPVSIAVHRDLVYVANAGDFVTGEAPSLVGFRLRRNGRLSEIRYSKREFPPPVDNFPTSRITDALFDPHGDYLVVSNTFADDITVFEVSRGGLLGRREVIPAVVPNPFGMTFVGDDVIAVTDANAMAGVGQSSMSTYRLRRGTLEVISAGVPNGETEACWVSVTPDGRNLYVSNAPSYNVQGPDDSSISHYRINRAGELELVEGRIDPRAGLPELEVNAAPLETFIPADGRFLYQLWAGLGEIGVYRIERDGGLVLVEEAAGTGLPLISPAGLTGY